MQTLGSNGALFGKEFWIVWLCLFVFGFFYDMLTDWLQRKTQSYTAFLVVGGVLVTVLAGGFLYGFETAAVVLGLFVGSGLWMIIGSIRRYAQDSEQARKDSLDDPMQKLGRSDGN